MSGDHRHVKFLLPPVLFAWVRRGALGRESSAKSVAGGSGRFVPLRVVPMLQSVFTSTFG